MFTLSKLVNVALGTVAFGSVGGIVVPVVLGINDFFLEGDTSKWSINIGELEKTEQEISEKLTKSKVKYSTALKWLEHLKKINFAKIIETFNNLFKTETQLEDKYKEIKQQLEELTSLITQEGAKSTESLDLQKQSKLLAHQKFILNQLVSGARNWDSELQKVICALEDESGKSSNCGAREWLRPLLNLISLKGVGESQTQSQAQQASASVSGGGTAASGGEAAKESLKKIKEELEKLSESISSFSRSKLLEQAKFSGQQVINWGKRVALELTLAHILARKDFLNSSMKSVQKVIEQLNKKLQQLVKEIHSKNQKLEELKKNIVVIKKYEGLFLNSLCNLHTIQNQECLKPSTK